jgi:hypothetical protein
MANLRESAELFLLFVLSASSVVKSRGLFRRGRRCNGREATARLSNIHANRVRSPDPWNPCHPWLSAPSLIRAYSCPLWFSSENFP